MLHDHRAFDRAEPDTKRAIAAIAPTIQTLLDQRDKPEPRTADEQYRHRTYLDELEAEAAGAASALGLTLDDLIGEAQRVSRRRPSSRSPEPSSRDRERSAPPPSRKMMLQNFAVEDAELTRQLLDKRQQIVAIDREIKVLVKRQAAVHAVLYKRGRRFGF